MLREFWLLAFWRLPLGRRIAYGGTLKGEEQIRLLEKSSPI